MAAVIRADIAFKSTVVVGTQNVKNAGFTFAVTVGNFREVTVGIMPDVADMGESNAIAMLADDSSNVVLRVGIQAAGAECQTVVRVIHHAQEAVYRFGIRHQAGETENIPGGIIHMDGHFDVALMADRHQLLQEVLQVFPELFFRDALVCTEQLTEMGHTFRLPAGEGHTVFLFLCQNIVCHFTGIFFDFFRFVIESGGAILQRMEEVGSGPVKHRHKVVADYFYAERCQITDGLDIVFNVMVAGRQADFDIIVDIDGFHHVHIEAVGLQLFLDFGDLFRLPDLSWQFVVQSPDNCAYAWNLFDVRERNLVVIFAVPAKPHLHWHVYFLLFKKCLDNLAYSIR